MTNKVYTIITLLIVNMAFSQMKITLTQSVNIAARQRMLSQRMSKDKIFIGENKKTKEAEKELNSAITEFQDNLKLLKLFAPTEQLKYKIGVEELAFDDYKNSILDNSKKSSLKVLNTSTIFLAICNDLVNELVNYSKTITSGNLNNTQKYNLENVSIATENSGKIRYLSQRFALYYAAYYFKLNEKPLEIKETIELMDKTLSNISRLEFTTTEIDDAISGIYADWNTIKKGLYGEQNNYTDSKSLNPEVLYDQCNSIMEKADKLAKTYATLNTQ